jgi:hypothetical protein
VTGQPKLDLLFVTLIHQALRVDADRLVTATSASRSGDAEQAHRPPLSKKPSSRALRHCERPTWSIAAGTDSSTGRLPADANTPRKSA